MTLAGLQPSLRPYAQLALTVAQFYGIPVTVTSVYRSCAEQRKLRQLFEEGKARYPANRPGDSAHNFGLAWDSTVPPHYQPAWNYIRRAIGWEVLDNDQIHAQLPAWRSYVAPGSCP